MCILRVLSNDDVEVRDSFLVLLNHLESLSALMDIPEIARDLLDAARVWEDRLLEFLKATVGQPKVVKDVRLICHVWSILESQFHCLDALLVLFICEVCDTLLVEDLWVVMVILQGCFKVSDGLLIVLHIKVALGTVPQEVNVVWLA